MESQSNKVLLSLRSRKRSSVTIMFAYLFSEVFVDRILRLVPLLMLSEAATIVTATTHNDAFSILLINI